MASFLFVELDEPMLHLPFKALASAWLRLCNCYGISRRTWNAPRQRTNLGQIHSLPRDLVNETGHTNWPDRFGGMRVRFVQDKLRYSQVIARKYKGRVARFEESHRCRGLRRWQMGDRALEGQRADPCVRQHKWCLELCVPQRLHATPRADGRCKFDLLPRRIRSNDD